MIPALRAARPQRFTANVPGVIAGHAWRATKTNSHHRPFKASGAAIAEDHACLDAILPQE